MIHKEGTIEKLLGKNTGHFFYYGVFVVENDFNMQKFCNFVS